MMADERQYDDLARSLDGEDVSLNAEQTAARDEILGAEKALGAAFAVKMPSGVMDRVRARMDAQAFSREFSREPQASAIGERDLLLTPSTGRRVIRIGPWMRAAGALAAAAVVLLVALVGWNFMFSNTGTETAKPTPTVAPGEHQEQLALLTLPTPMPEDKTLGLLAREMDEVAGEMLTPPVPAPVDVEMEVIQHDVDDLRLGAPLGGPADVHGHE